MKRTSGDPNNESDSLEHQISEWYILKGENRFGPFNYGEMIRMLQEKIVYGFDFAWHSGLSGWKRIADIADFQESAIRNLAKNEKFKKGCFADRKHPRVPHKGQLIVHDQHSWWRGEAFEISSGGVGLFMENTLIVPGQQLNLHFKPYDQFPAFNAVGEVVNKKYMENIKNKTPLQYGVRFMSVSGAGKEKLLDLLKDPAA